MLPGLQSCRADPGPAGRADAASECVVARPPDPALADTAVRQALTEAEEMDLAAATRPEQRVVRIEATATVASGRTRTRRALVRLDLGLDGRSWHMLAWDRAGT
jgi:hypothetical protein